MDYVNQVFSIISRPLNNPKFGFFEKNCLLLLKPSLDLDRPYEIKVSFL